MLPSRSHRGLRITITVEAHPLNQAPPLLQSRFYPLAANAKVAFTPEPMGIDLPSSPRLNDCDALSSDIEGSQRQDKEEPRKVTDGADF